MSEIETQEHNMDSDQEMQKLKFILDIPLQLTVELGRTKPAGEGCPAAESGCGGGTFQAGR